MKPVRSGAILGTLYKLSRKPASLLGLVIVLAFFGWALVEGLLQGAGMLLHQSHLGWVLLQYSPFQTSFASPLLPPSWSHPMGTDDLGRDIWTRVLYAAPTDAAISVAVVIGGVVVGSVFGLTAGYFGGAVEEVNMRFTDLFLAFPALILALVIETTLGREVVYAIVALVAVWWPSYARIFRGEMLRIKSFKLFDSAVLSGLSGFAIIRKHAVRASLNTIASYATIDLGNVILVYSILSFLGLGVTPPFPEWGTLVASGLQFFPQWWWYSILPGAVVTIIVIGTALFGDGLRDVLAGEL